MLTRWASEVTPDNAWNVYPRPLMERSDWANLNGLWEYSVTPRGTDRPKSWNGNILVPFCPESALSGVGRLIEPGETLWYRRILPDPPKGKRTILNFEAVDYDAVIWVNGKEVGTHTGGFTAFSCDITDALTGGGNELMIRVYDETEGYQLHGKQKLKNGGIWYTRVIGIWQTVWLEHVPHRYLADLAFDCDIRTGTIRVLPKRIGPELDGETLRVTVSFDGQEAASAEGIGPVFLEIAKPSLWSPSQPDLYNLSIEILDGSGQTVDSVRSYTAFREFGKTLDAGGHWRFTLNGDPIFHWGTLDQGWWPDGLLTPPSDEAMRSDIEFLKAAGFNMIRKHVKVEPRRYYAHCDRIGMLVWQDQVSSGYGRHRENPDGISPPWTRLDPNPIDATWPDDEHKQWVVEYKRMVDQLREHPCIAVWVPFNEAWGQHRTTEIGEIAAACDSTRHLNIASGGNYWPIGDVADHHSYPNPEFSLDDVRFDDMIKVVGEFGGHGWPVAGHLWDKGGDSWGYGGLPENLVEWKVRFAKSIDLLCDLRRKGIAGGVYTQTTDVEAEINGLLTYDRHQKVAPAWLREQSERLLDNAEVASD